MFCLITAVSEHGIKGRVNQRGDFKNRRCPPATVCFLYISDFFIERDGRGSDLFHAVGPVRVEIGKTEQPAVIYFNLVRRPRVERQVFDFFYSGIHDYPPYRDIVARSRENFYQNEKLI